MPRTVVKVIGWVILGQWLAQPSPAMDDAPRAIDPNGSSESHFRPVGLLIDRKLHKSATGVLISPCHVLTNRHAAGGIRPQGDSEGEVEEDLATEIVGYRLEFHIGFDVSEPEKFQTVEHGFVVAGGRGGDADDWALLRLEHPIGKRYGFTRLASVEFSPELAVVTAGFPSDKLYRRNTDGNLVFDAHLWTQRGVLLRDYGFWTADIRVVSGQSGAPVYWQDVEEFVVIGLLRAEIPTPSRSDAQQPAGSGAVAQIVPTVLFIDRVTAAMARYTCAKR